MTESDSVGTAAKPLIHSSDEYSSDDELNPKSMLDIRKRGHIPGQYKRDAHLAKDGVFGESIDAVPSIVDSANKNGKNSQPPVPTKPTIKLSDSLLSYDTCDDLPKSLPSGVSINADKPKPVPKQRGKSKRVSSPEMIAETSWEKAISEKDYVKEVASPKNVVLEMDTGNKNYNIRKQEVTMLSDYDNAVSDSLLLDAEPDNEPLITVSCNKIELDKSTESDKVPIVIDSSFNDSVVIEGHIEISFSANTSDSLDKDDSMKPNGAVGIADEAVTETASKRGKDIEACEVEDILSEADEIFDSILDDKSQKIPTYSDSIKQLSGNNEVGPELEEIQSSGDKINYELDSGQLSVILQGISFNDDIEHAGYEIIVSAKTTGDHCSLGSKSTDLSTMTSFEILSQGESSDSVPDNIDEGNDKGEKHHVDVDRVKDDENDCIKLQHIAVESENCIKTASHTEAIEKSIKDSDECPLSKENSAPPSVTYADTDMNKPNTTVADTKEEAKVVDADAEESTRESKTQSIDGSTKGSNESQKSQGDSVPPSIMPKSETVLESLQVRQGKVETPNLEQVSQSESGNKPFEVTPEPLSQMQGDKSSVESSSPQIQNEPTPPPVMPKPEAGIWQQPYVFPYLDKFGSPIYPLYSPMQNNTTAQNYVIHPYSPYQQQQPFMQQMRVTSHPDNVDSKASESHKNADVKKTPYNSFSPNNKPCAVSHDKTPKCEVDTSGLKQTAAVKTPSRQPKPAKRVHNKSREQENTIDKPGYDTPKTSRLKKRVPIRASRKPKVVEDPKEFCIQFKGISQDTTPFFLTNIVEITTELETDSEKVVLNESTDCAWVILEAKPDLEKLKERINRKGINGSYPIVSEVPLSSIPSKTEKKPVPVRSKYIESGKKSSTTKGNEVVKKHEGSLIFFKGINPITKEETIRYFVEAATKGTIDQIIFNYARVDCVVHVEGDSTPDLSKLRRKIERIGLEGFKPEIKEMPLPTSIAVSSLGTIYSLESLGLYFESRRSRGDKILQDPYESEDGTCCIVEYENHEVVERVCMKKDHQLDKVSLRVSPCYKCDLGVIWDAKLHSAVAGSGSN